MDPAQAAALLRTPAAIRSRCRTIYEAAARGESDHFTVDRGAPFQRAIDAVVSTTREQYPSLDIPFHSRFRHFSVGGIDRVARLAGYDGLSPDERLRAAFDLAVTSVLLDAGAGPDWSYLEPSTGQRYARSEGLAVASIHLFAAGAFSSDPQAPLRADAAGLKAFSALTLAEGFQVRDDNPLVGLEGRAALLRRLGDAIEASPDLFGTPARIGHLADHLRAQETPLPAPAILDSVLRGLGSIWPGRITLGDHPLGDVWRHPAAGGEGLTAGLVPFHKLSQWLTYSLVEPLLDAGTDVVDLDGLTGLAEYRNGGLFVDSGVLIPKAPVDAPLPPDHSLIVEWRALTLTLLDDIAPAVRDALGTRDLPLASILEGGTWAAGRALAKARRPDGTPPIRVASDGTVF